MSPSQITPGQVEDHVELEWRDRWSIDELRTEPLGSHQAYASGA